MASQLPKSVLQQLTCSSCKKYLSVAPIKVYPNRQVKCGRCSQEDDGGTTSSLYETIIKNVKFPCIRHMEGCNKYFSITEMQSHEQNCLGRKYSCLACYTFEDYSYALALHIETAHKELLLENCDFLLSIDEADADNLLSDDTFKTKKYFYYDYGVLLFISASYNSKMLYLQLHVVGEDDSHASGNYSLYTIENKLIHKGRVSKCSKWGGFGAQIDIINLDDLNFPKNIMFCKFQVLREQTALLPISDTTIIDPSVSRAILRCQFDNVGDYNWRRKESTFTYFVKNIPWTIYIQTVKYNGTVYLGCFLRTETKYVCKVSQLTFNLICKDKIGNIKSICDSQGDSIPSLANNDQYINWGILEIVKWNTLIDAANGYLINNSIKIEIELSVKSESFVGRCCQCKSVCTTCKK